MLRIKTAARAPDVGRRSADAWIARTEITLFEVGVETGNTSTRVGDLTGPNFEARTMLAALAQGRRIRLAAR